MAPVTVFKGRKIALFGLGGSGLATARALVAGGAEVGAWDDNAKTVQQAFALGLAIVNLNDVDWREFAALVLAPGVPLTHPQPHWTVKKARGADVEIIGDIELFCRQRAAKAPDAPFIAITGTNGKSTTTALVAHILRAAGRDVAMGGNIGVPVLELPPAATHCIHVIECSSYQIDLAPSLAPSVGALINVTPDHLDRHGTLERYAAIKERLVAQANVALIGVDDEPCRAIVARLKASGRGGVVTIAREPGPGADISFDNHRIIDARGGRSQEVWLKKAPNLRGAHNAQNAAFAFAAASAVGLSLTEIAAGLTSFPGLAHRMESLGRIGRVLFINDSKATNADAAEKALRSFRNIFWIVGGKPKDGGIEPLRPLFARIAKAYLIGAASDEFARTLGGEVAFERSQTLDAAVASAARDAALCPANEPVVLLSPACASFDQFPNFEARGDCFRALVSALFEARATPELSRSLP
jgi:UDP-N-acetylmuramoylalanine--D-glutamate ligase